MKRDAITVQFDLEDLRGDVSIAAFGVGADDFPRLELGVGPDVRLEASFELGYLILLLEYYGPDDAPPAEKTQYRATLRAFLPPARLRLLRDFLGFALNAEEVWARESDVPPEPIETDADGTDV